jgi:carboxylesterase type B
MDCAFGLHSFSFFPSIAAMIAVRFRSIALAALSLATAVWPAAGRAAPMAPVPQPAAPIATTTSGKVRGYVDQEINIFKGIPYGGDTAKRRFQAPGPPDPWNGVRDATAFGPIAPQLTARRGLTTTPEGSVISEDCLRLNVWTPALRDGHRRPVLVYFHGGAYNNGSVGESSYTASGGADAQQLADRMSEALLAFARTGNPNTSALPPWPRFDLAKRATMIFDLPIRGEDDPRGAERRLFAPIVYAQPGT